MALIKNDKNLVREFVRINFSSSNASLPDFDLAEQRFLLPIIGQELYEELQVIADSDPAAEATEDSKRDAELLKKCRSVIVPLAYFIELPTLQTQITDAGIRTTSTDKLEAAHRWEYNEVKEYLVEKGSYAIDALLSFLFSNKDAYSSWKESEQYKEANSLIFKTGDDFNRYFRVGQPYRIYWELRPLIQEVEDFCIVSAIGEDFYQELKAKEDPEKEEVAAIQLIKKAVAQLVIVKAVEKLSVKVTERGFTTLLGAGNADSLNSGDAPASGTSLSLLYESCQRSGDAYLLQLKDHLNKYASDGLFKTFFGSSLYEKPVTTCRENPNAKRRGIVGF